jgi:hypothetical protein
MRNSQHHKVKETVNLHVMKYWKYKTNHSCPRHKIELSDQHHTPARLPRYPLNKGLAGLLTGFVRCIISDFHGEVYEIFALLQYYAAYSGYSLSTFRDTLSVSTSDPKRWGR